MNRIKTIAVACTLGASVPVHAGLFGVASFSPFGTQSLYSINTSNGVATLVGSTGLRQISDLSWDGANSRLVALTVAGDQFVVDTATGASTLLVDGSFGVPEGSLAFNGGTAYTTLFDNLHAWSGSAWSQVGVSGLGAGADISGLSFGGGMLLGLALNGADADQIVSFNVATGAATVIGSTGTNAGSVAGLTYGFIGGQWYMTDGGSLYSVNATTGAATYIGAHGLSGFSGLAFVPAPGVAALLTLSGLLLNRRRR
jgi:hypothetical protein